MEQLAFQPPYNTIFKGVDACFALYDVTNDRELANFNNPRITIPLPPCSTFKIALSLIGFDCGILIDRDTPRWTYKPEYSTPIESHAKDHTPQSWMANSVVWYSQQLTLRLGMAEFKRYISALQYGNRDLSGCPGANDGLTHSWLNSSLKISPLDQIKFLTKLVTNSLPVSKRSTELTRQIMFIDELPDGWKMFGKTGSAGSEESDGTPHDRGKIGWFVGWLEKLESVQVFALTIQDRRNDSGYGGITARALGRELLDSLAPLRRR